MREKGNTNVYYVIYDYISWYLQERARERESESEKEREGKTSVYYKNYERVLWHLPSYITIFTIRERRERLSDLWFLS